MSEKKKRSDVEFDDFVQRENIRLKTLEREIALEGDIFELKKQQRIAEVQALLKKKKDNKDDQ